MPTVLRRGRDQSMALGGVGFGRCCVDVKPKTPSDQDKCGLRKSDTFWHLAGETACPPPHLPSPHEAPTRHPFSQNVQTPGGGQDWQPRLATPRAPSSNKGILAGGSHESREQWMRRIPQRRELRLKQGAKKKGISGKLKGPDLAARGAGDAQTGRFEPLPIRGVRLVIAVVLFRYFQAPVDPRDLGIELQQNRIGTGKHRPAGKAISRRAGDWR